MENLQKAEENVEIFKITDEPKTVTLKNKIAYAVGDMGNNFLFDMGQLYLLKYFTDVAGLPSALAGTVFLVAKIWDGFMDISVGTWIDNRANISKRGKFRPFMLWAAIPLGLLLIANFTIPNFSVTGKLLYAYVAYMIFGTVYSISNIPFGSMVPTMTRNSQERDELASYRTIGANLGLMLATIGFTPIVLLLPTQKIGYAVAVIIFAILGVLCQWYCYANVKEVYKVPTKPRLTKEELKEQYKALFKNKPLIVISVVNLLTFSSFNLKSTVQVYFAQYVLKDTAAVSYLGFFSIGMILVAAVVVPFLTRKFDKKIVYVAGCLIWAIGDILGFFFTTNATTFIFFTTIAYFGNGFATTLNWSMISDCVEYGEWQSGVRSEGLVYSFFTFFRKLSQAVAGFVPGIVLAWVGYIPNQQQTAEAIFGIRGLMFLYSGSLSIFAIIMILKLYPLTDARFKVIMKEVVARRNKKTTKG